MSNNYLRRCFIVGLTALMTISSGVVSANELTQEQSDQLALVPDSAKDNYNGFWHTTKLYKMADSWKPRKGPYQFCYSESYQGNSWRSNVLAQLQKQVAAYAKAGLSKGDLIVTNSNGDTNTQLTQVNSLVSQGCDVVFASPTSPTGLCKAVKDAADKGVLFLTLESPVHCPEAVNIAQNAYQGAIDNTNWLIDKMGGKGNLFVVTGFAGNSLTVAWDVAINEVLAKHPEVKKIGQVHGNWTPSVAKSETLKFVATHPQQIDGVWSGGLMAVGALQGLTQSGRKPVPTTDNDNTCDLIAYMKENANVPIRALIDGGGPVAYTAFSVAARILAGQQLAVNTILYKLPEITAENLSDYYDPSMNLQSTCWADPKDGRLISSDYLNSFFTGGEKLPVELTP